MWKNKLIQVKNSILKRRGFIKFLGVGGLNTIVDFLLYSLIANLFLVYPPFASIISTGLTLILSFFLNHHFVFRSSKRRRTVAVQFILITLFNVWFIQTAVITFLVHNLDTLPYFVDHQWTLNSVAKIGGICVSFILNFLGYRYIFNDRKKNDSKENN